MWYVHVNQHVIRKNIRAKDKEPPISIRKGKSGPANYVYQCELPAGSVMVYSPDEPLLSCGARLVIECPEEPKYDVPTQQGATP